MALFGTKLSAAEVNKLATGTAGAADVSPAGTVPELMGIPANKIWLWGAALAVVAALIIFVMMYF